MTARVSIDRALLLKILRHLEIIVPSLDRLGSAASLVTAEEYQRLTTDFLTDWRVFQRLAEIRSALTSLVDYDEVEAEFGEIEVWDLNHRKPEKEPFERGS